MGMFDSFYMPRVELPNSQFSEEEFQSKDFDCEMTSYRISGDGRVTKARYREDDEERFDQWAPTDLTGHATLRGRDLTLKAAFVQGRLQSLEILR